MNSAPVRVCQFDSGRNSLPIPLHYSAGLCVYLLVRLSTRILHEFHLYLHFPKTFVVSIRRCAPITFLHARSILLRFTHSNPPSYVMNSPTKAKRTQYTCYSPPHKKNRVRTYIRNELNCKEGMNGRVNEQKGTDEIK